MWNGDEYPFVLRVVFGGERLMVCEYKAMMIAQQVLTVQ